MSYPKKVTICDVGTRDGFQIEHKFIPTATKIEVINAIIAAGVRKLEVTSFVSPRAVPQMADAAEVYAGIDKSRGAELVCLIPNRRGAEDAAKAGVKTALLFLSASETHNLTNVNRSVQASLDGLKDVMAVANGAGMAVHGAIATSFGCPFEGDVPAERVADLAVRMRDMGMHHVSLGDTTGMATPPIVKRVVEAIRRRAPALELTLHFHNTRGLGLVNVMAGLEMGVTHFEGSIGGLGGCPFAPGATGNICTEDCVNLMHELGIETGIDLDALCAVARRVEQFLGRPLPGQVMRAGPRSKLHTIAAAKRAVG
ncbi:MAG: hydroxymethylglutaryl-CoA lyase [Alphaproteobacteria bacterium]|nr:hydroxymethylglutaryl-CoA lyase [Alphaproteobacteria bacterium]